MDKSQTDKLDVAVKMGVIPILGKVGDEMLERVLYVVGKLLIEQRKKVIAIINSSGGSSRHCLEIYDILKMYPGDITGLVFGQASSSAAIILQACKKRLATPNAKILVHHGTCELKRDLLFQDDKLEVFLQRERVRERQFYAILRERMCASDSTIRKLCFEDRSMFPDEAIKLKLLDGVWKKPLPWNLEELG